MARLSKVSNSKGFTLIEMLVVISIIGVLAAIVLLALNPAEVLKSARDAQRVSDLDGLSKAIIAAVLDEGNNAALPVCMDFPANYWQTTCGKSGQNLRATDGSGWIKATDGSNPLNLSKYFAVLPVDPVNNQAIVDAKGTSIGAVYYYYKSDGSTFKIYASIESQRYVNTARNDGGIESCGTGIGRCFYEVGTYLQGYQL